MPLSCVHCEHDVENFWHVFLICPFAQNCWQEAGLLSTITRGLDSMDGFVDWLFEVLTSWNDNVVRKVVMVMWGIWCNRNATLWGRDCASAHQVVSSSVQLFYD